MTKTMMKTHSLKKALLAITVSATSVLTPASLFAAGEEAGAIKEPAILKEKRCYACHAMEKMLIGPPYTAIGAIHSANKEVMRDVLVDKIINGGGSNWGQVPMVPNPHVTQEEAEQMVDWIFSLSPN